MADEAGPGRTLSQTRRVSAWLGPRLGLARKAWVAREDPAQDRALVVRSLAFLYIGGASLSLLWLALPHTATADERGVLLATLAAYAVGLALFVAFERVPVWLLKVAVAVSTVVITGAVLATNENGSAYVLYYMWATLYMFCFFSLRQALLQAGFVGVAFGAVLILQRDLWNEEVARWLLTMSTLFAAGFLVRYLASGLRYRSLHDPLTGLPNRRMFVTKLDTALAERAADRLTAVLFLDLDRFKFINDSFGHPFGDRLLCAVARRLEGRVRAGDLVARFGGDEFAVLCSEVDNYYDAISLGDRLCEALEEPIKLGPDELHVSASVGLALAHGRALDSATLVRNADTAMYQAKELGGARCELFGEALRERVVTRLRTEHDLRRLLERGELEVAYQPIVSLTDGEVVGVEALARWNDPGRGLVPPEEFIPIAELSGLIVPLGLQVLERACAQAVEWDALGGPLAGLPVSVNLSVRQFSHVDLVANVAATLQSTGLRPARLTLEITESTLMEQTTEPMAMLDALRAVGVRLALDDFGSGYSSLSYLRQFPLDQLKLDREFIATLRNDGPERAIVGAVVNMARALNIAVIAEGIETREQHAVLMALGCELGQGFLFARPHLPAALEEVLRVADETATSPPEAGEIASAAG